MNHKLRALLNRAAKRGRLPRWKVKAAYRALSRRERAAWMGKHVYGPEMFAPLRAPVFGMGYREDADGKMRGVATAEYLQVPKGFSLADGVQKRRTTIGEALVAFGLKPR